MANIYVRSSDGDNLDTGATWALAKATLAGAAAIAVAGDTIYVSSLHSESSAVALVLTFTSTLSSQVKILSVDDTGNPEPPTALLAGATVATTGASNLTIAGFIYAYGINFNCGNATGASQFILSSATFNKQVYESCVFTQSSNNSGTQVRVLGASVVPSTTIWKNCNYSNAQAASRIELINGRFLWSGGQVLSAQTGLVIFHSGSSNIAEIENVDLSGMTSTAVLNPVTGSGTCKFRNCKPPTNWTGTLVSGTKNVMWRSELFNTDTGDTNYSTWIEDCYGSIRHATTLYLSGTNGIKLNGASVPLSYKMTAESTASYPFALLEGMWCAFVNESVASQTITLEIIHNESAALTDGDIWLESDYPLTSSSTQFTRLDDAKANIMAAGVAQDTSTADWDDGLTERADSTAYSVGNFIKSSGTPGNAFICTGAGTSEASVPAGYTGAADGDTIADGTATFKAMKRQKLSVTITAAEQGVIKVRPVLADASAVVWVAAKVTVA